MTRDEACAACTATGCGAICALYQPEWPPRTQDDIATAEAGSQPHAGADTARHAGRVARNRARYGNGGLFDQLEEPAA